MNRLDESILKYKSVVLSRLQPYGFKEEGNGYVYRTQICGGQMSLTVRIDLNGDLQTEVCDVETGEPYTLFSVDGAAGEFVGKVRADYIGVLEDIAEKCFEKKIFKNSCTQAVLDYALQKYGDKPEFLWDNLPDGAILRRKDSGKWYVLIMTVPLKRLGIDSGATEEIIDVRMNPEQIDKTVDNATFFRGYHMNKKHWITFCLNGSVPLEKVLGMIDESYKLAAK